MTPLENTIHSIQNGVLHTPTASNTFRECCMKNTIKLFALLICFLLVGCSWFSGNPMEMVLEEDDCDFLTIAFYQPPVIGNLDYKMVIGSKAQAIVLSDFQHTLSLPGSPRKHLMPTVAKLPELKPLGLFTVKFKFDSTRLDPSELLKLNQFLVEAKTNGYTHVKITGHTDSQGSRRYNQKLSLARAYSVQDYLLSHISSNLSVETEGMGEDHPVATNSIEQGRQENRRAELTKYKKMTNHDKDTYTP